MKCLARGSSNYLRPNYPNYLQLCCSPKVQKNVWDQIIQIISRTCAAVPEKNRQNDTNYAIHLQHCTSRERKELKYFQQMIPLLYQQYQYYPQDWNHHFHHPSSFMISTLTLTMVLAPKSVQTGGFVERSPQTIDQVLHHLSQHTATFSYTYISIFRSSTARTNAGKFTW